MFTDSAGATLIGMVHLPALPGSPRFSGDRDAIHRRARADAQTLADAGFDAVLVENFGDAPFYPERVPTHVVAELTAVVSTVRRTVSCPVGVNVLRNDATAALSVASATGGSFVRVNVHTGVRATDQGIVEGQAHETVRLREQLDADVSMFADVAVKHAAAIADRDIEALARETAGRGLADGIIVSGAKTGAGADTSQLKRVGNACKTLPRDIPVIVGSGVTPETAPELLELADGAIVGTALKKDGVTENPVDPARATALIEAVTATQ